MPATARKERYGSAVRCGERVTRLRKARKLTLKQVAEKTGFSPQQIFLVEKGDINTPVGTLERIADALGVPFEHVTSEEDSVALNRASWLTDWVFSQPSENGEAVETFLNQLLQRVRDARKLQAVS